MASKYDPKLFKAIADFVGDLYLAFGKQQDTLRIFQHFIQRLNAKPCDVSQKELCECFSRFVRQNEEAIATQDLEKLKIHVIAFKGRVNIKLKEIFRLADQVAKDSIWGHLKLILTLVDPDGALVENLIADLKQQALVPPPAIEESKESQFLESILSKFVPKPEDIESGASGDSLPNIDLMGMVNTVTTMFQSQNGLDPEKLLTSMSSLTQKALGQFQLGGKQ